jgi:hypothetical protein
MDKNNKKLIIGQLLQIYLPMFFLLAGITIGFYFLLASGQNNAQTIQDAGGIAAVYLMFLFAGPIFLLLLPLCVLIALNGKLSQAARNTLPKIRMKAMRINESAQSAVSTVTRPIIELDAVFSVISNKLGKKEKDGE